MTDDTDLLSQPYFAQAVSYPRPSLAEEEYIIAAARAGDVQAREAIITSCLGYVLAVAKTLSLSRNIEFDELIGIGNLILVEHLEEALTKDNAFSYLKSKVKWRLVDACSHWDYTHGLSWDPAAAEPKLQPERDYSWLYAALTQLTDLQREAVYTYFGLNGRSEQSLYKLSLERIHNPRGNLMYNRLSRGLAKLRLLLVCSSGQDGMGYTYPA